MALLRHNNRIADSEPSAMLSHELKIRMLVLATVSVVIALEEPARLRRAKWRKKRKKRAKLIAEVVIEYMRQKPKRPAVKNRRIVYNHALARNSVHSQYWAEVPRFGDREFERSFRITRTMAEEILRAAHANPIYAPFYEESIDALGRPCICPKVKLLCGLDQLGSGMTSKTAARIYEMSETTARLCLKNLTQVLVNDNDLQNTYLRKMNRIDAENVTGLHKAKHGVDGMIGSLDCMHIHWRTCPVVWQGSHQGHKGKPSIILEALIDHNLWVWHAAFGAPGSLNDINVWDRSPLLTSFLDGTFSDGVDFEFEIGGETFQQLWIMVDGIYPELSRFVKTIRCPLTPSEHRYAKWQESARKDVERGFGVLKRKFAILTKLIELWSKIDITNVVFATIILHNMMVKQRTERKEVESADWYDCKDIYDAEEEVEVSDIDDDDHANDAAPCNRSMLNTSQEVMVGSPQTMARARESASARYDLLYNKEEHHRLRKAIIRELDSS